MPTITPLLRHLGLDLISDFHGGLQFVGLCLGFSRGFYYYNYIFFSYFSGEFSSPAIRTGYTCEGEELLIKCEEQDEDIQIIRANYGRFSIAICNDDGKTHWSVNCMSPKTRHILQKK